MSGPLPPIGNPTSTSHRERGAFQDGIQNGATTGHIMPMPSAISNNGPQMNGHYVRGKANSDFYTDGVQNVNGRSTYHMAQDVRDWEKGDTCPDLITFARVPPYGGKAAENMRTVSYPMFGIVEFNRRLKQELSMRVKYGNEINVNALLRDFTYVGIQQSKQTALNYFNSKHEENNLTVRGRTRIPNIWLSLKGTRSINEMTVLYMCWHRRKYNGDIAADSEMWMESPSSTIQSRKRKLQEADDETNDAKRANAADVESMSSEPLNPFHFDTTTLPDKFNARSIESLKVKSARVATPVGASGTYYWCLEPWISIDRCAPHPCHYNGDVQDDPHNQYIGDYLHIGQIVHNSKGPSNRTMTQINQSRNALYVTERSEEYQRSLRYIDEIEVHLGLGRC